MPKGRDHHATKTWENFIIMKTLAPLALLVILAGCEPQPNQKLGLTHLPQDECDVLVKTLLNDAEQDIKVFVNGEENGTCKEADNHVEALFP